MDRGKPAFPPPKVIRILSVVQVMFAHKETQAQSMLKVELKYLNQKLQKLQREGMTITGIYFVDVDKEPHYVQGGSACSGTLNES